MRIIDSARSGIDITRPKLEAKWIILFVMFAGLMLVLIGIAKWGVTKLSTLPVISTVAGSGMASAASQGGTAVPGWDY